jgi:heme-binding HmuY-like protein
MLFIVRRPPCLNEIMKKTLKIFAVLLIATFLFHFTLDKMLANIEDFETVALPPKKLNLINTTNPTLTIDATSKDRWTLVSFASGKTFHVNDLDEQKDELDRLDWDLGFQRTKIVTNSGVTNPKGKVGAVNLGPVDFDSILEVPETDFIQDSRSFGSRVNKALNGWYNYRTRTHNIESKKNVYIVKTSDNNFLKMRILNYYCSKNAKDCRSVMCTRDEAACLTVEYILSDANDRKFAVSKPPEVTPNLEPDSTTQ